MMNMMAENNILRLISSNLKNPFKRINLTKKYSKIWDN